MKRNDARVPAFAIGSRFGGYAPESENAVRKHEVRSNPAVDAMMAILKTPGFGTSDDSYEAMAWAAARLEYSARDVARFTVAVGACQEEQCFARAGMLISALINEGKDSEYTITTRHLQVPLNELGVMNRKNIIVDGDVGSQCGRKMECGSITVNGNAWMGVGMIMEGGTITINGNAEDSCGNAMKRGTIVVKGDAGGTCGLCMDGGSVAIEGNAGDYCGDLMHGGTITVNGNAAEHCCSGMKGGSVTVKGDVGFEPAPFMEGGELHIGGECGKLGIKIKGGKIFHRDELISDGTLWTRFRNFVKGVFG
jgi:glutamate synthase domain-containing protein 3